MTSNNIREQPDNKLVDFLSAILAGLTIWFLDFSNIPQFQRSSFRDVILQSGVVKVGAFSVIAFLFLMLKNRWRVRWGWIVIATLGVVIIAAIDEIVYQRTVAEPDFFAGLSPFPMEILLFLLPALLVMGAAHFLGLMIQRTFRGSKESA